METQINWTVWFFDLFSDSVNWNFIFGLKRAENSIPNNKSGTIVLVNVPVIGCMVYPVMGWGGKEELNEARKLNYVFSMYPELIKHLNLVADKKHDGVESSNDHRQEENDLDILGPAQSERNGKVVFR